MVMEEFNKLASINSLNISQNKGTHQFVFRSEGAKPQGKLDDEIYDNYYDINNTITTAFATDPNDPDAQTVVAGVITPVYNRETVFESLERNAPYIWITNDEDTGGATLFVICSHRGGEHFSRERPIYPTEYKVYKNVYEIRLRSASAGAAYRVSEYEIGMHRI